MNRIQTKVGSLSLENPTLLASGMMGETGESLLAVAKAGAGGVVTKSVGIEPRSGYENPTLVEFEYGYLNAMGLPNPGIDAYREEMKTALNGKVPIIGSIFAITPEDFALLAWKMQEYGASAVELNLSCPHARGLGMEIGVDPVAVRKIVREVKGSVSIPVLAKLTPNTHRLTEVAKAVEEADGDGIVAINTLKAIAISIEARRPVLQNKVGGLSGPAVKPVGLRAVYDLYEAVDIPVVGVGGIETWRDVVEYMMAGACAVEIGSAIGRKGLGVFREICDGLSAYAEAERVQSLEDIVGVAHD
ncbi:MAG TPA: dihydroorotate dehydrogenase [Methanomassiliicoccales archaeon]|nr:dihydroorotate dehydrogenase [Methanomassiliicoccales archaeon]